jgi:hypothetical protein
MVKKFNVWEQRGEMAQTRDAHMNKRIKII